MEADDQLPTALDQPQRSPARLLRENEIVDNDNRNPITYTRAVARLRQRQPEQFDRLQFLPGEKMQVDYGEGAPTRVPGTEHYRKPRLFVATLRYSRRSFRRVVWRSSQETWARLHEQAWRYFGGSCRYVVLDNLKEGVLRPDLYEPELNRDALKALASCCWDNCH